MDVQQQRYNHQAPSGSKLDLQHRSYDVWTDHQSQGEAPTPPKPTKKRASLQSSPLDEKASDAAPIQSRNLQPIQSGNLSAAPQHVPQRASPLHSVPPPPLSKLSEPRLSGRIRIDGLLNPISGDKTSASGRLDQVSADASSPPPLRTSLPSAPFQVAPTGEPRASFSAPFTFSEKDVYGRSQDQMIILWTEKGPIQVPIDMRIGSKIADTKRKRNAESSSRTRQQRRPGGPEDATLRSQIRDINEEKEYYRQERDFLRDILQQRGISLPPRAPSPRQKGYASLDRQQDQDTGTSAPNGNRNTPIRTNEYVPPQWRPLVPAVHASTIRGHYGTTTQDVYPRAI